MLKEGHFGTIEAVSLSTLILTTKVFYTSIRVLIKTTSTAAWYVTLFSCAVSIFLFLLVYQLLKRFPGKNLNEVFELVMGKYIGAFFSFIFCAYFIYYAGSNIREFLEMIKAYNLPYTPPSVIIFVFLLVVIAFAYVGIEGIARVAYVSSIVVVLGIAILLLLAYPFYVTDFLFPLGGYGIKEDLTEGFWRASAYSDVVFLAFFINTIHGTKAFKKVGMISLCLSGITISVSVLCNLMAFEYTQGGENLSPLFQLSRIIYFNRFFQRIESIFLFIWVISSLVAVSIAFYTAVSIFCKVCRIENHRPTLLPFSFFTFMVAILPENLSETLEVNIKFIRQYSIFIVYLIPILVLFVAVLLGKKGADPANEKG